MKRLFPFLALLILTGCMSQITDRIDTMNRSLFGMTNQLDETNARLASIEKSMKKLTGEPIAPPAPPAHP